MISLPLAIWSYFQVPSLATGGLVLFALVVIGAEQLILTPRGYGVVRDQRGRRVPHMVLQLLRTDTHKVVASQVTDEQGRYSFLVRPGTYQIKIVSPGWSLHPAKEGARFTVDDERGQLLTRPLRVMKTERIS